MPLRIRILNPWLWAVPLVWLCAGPVAAQPPSPLELVRGLRENGQFDLALEYLKELEGKPLSPDDKAAIQLERAKCLLEASEDEADEGTRQGMIAEAKEMLNTFVSNHAKHPRAVEGLLSVAKLTSLDAKEQLGRARKMEIPPPSTDAAERREREAAQQKQYKEASAARPLFQLASTRFNEASGILRTRLEDKTLDPLARKALEREAFEAELASGINQFSIAETFVPDEILTNDQKKLRNAFLETAKEVFGKLAKGSATSRTRWVAQAWIAEVTYEQNDFAAAAAEVAAVLKSTAVEAEDGKRLARFFALRRNVKAALNEGTPAKINASITEMRGWLERFGNPRKPTPEVYAVRYYLARTLHYQADVLTPPPKPPAVLTVGETARKLLTEAERIYRGLAQTDHEFTARAARHRMSAVRKLLGDADQNPLSYTTFENAQMASLIQLGKLVAAETKAEKLADAEKPDEKKIAEAKAEVQAARGRVIALLERARLLATPQDNPADVIDVLLRLIYFYGQNEQPYNAAVLGEFVAYTVKTTGGKAALAGLLGLNGYLKASTLAKAEDPEVALAARQVDRDRAAALARFLDEKYPNDAATDAARLQLADLLKDEKKFMEAYDMLVKIRPGFSRLTTARLLQVFVVRQIVIPADSKASKEDKARLFRRTASELAKVPKPPSIAGEDEVRDYLKARCSLALLMLAQERADPETEARNAGFNQALDLATAILAEVPTFDSMLLDPKAPEKKLNLDGQEMYYLALDTYTRSLYLRSRAMTRNGQLDGAMQLVQPTLDQVQKGGALFTDEMKAWAANAGSDEPDAKQKARVGKLAEGVDQKRVDVILAGFRVRVEQAKAAEAATLLDLMLKAGGSVEASLPLLEPVGRELAARLTILRREGKTDDAKNLSAGLTVLLDKIRTVPNLPMSSVLFIGNTLQTVGENEKALELLRKVPAPKAAGWETLPADQLPRETPSQIRDYATAQLAIARRSAGRRSTPRPRRC